MFIDDPIWDRHMLLGGARGGKEKQADHLPIKEKDIYEFLKS